MVIWVVPLTDAEILAVNNTIRKACRDVLPYNAIREDAAGGTQVLEDIRQSVWVKLLETKAEINPQVAFKAAKHACTYWMRKELPVLPVSQMALKSADVDDEESEPLMPWDMVVWGPGPDAKIVHMLNELNSEKKQQNLVLVHEEIKGLTQADRRFLLGYLSKKQAHRGQQWMRFQRLVEKLRKAVCAKV